MEVLCLAELYEHEFAFFGYKETMDILWFLLIVLVIVAIVRLAIFR